MDDRDDGSIAAPAARGLLTGWLAAKTLPRLFRLGVWAIRGALVTAWGVFVWRRTRTQVLAGALDERPDPGFGTPPSVVARERGVLGWVRGPGTPSP